MPRTLAHPRRTRALPGLVRRGFAALAAVAASAALIAGGATPASALPVGLSVSITNNLDETSPESAVTYTAVLENASADVVELRLVLTVPDFVEITDAAGAEHDGTVASWPVTVEPGASTTVEAAAQIGAIPAEILWLAATVEVFEPGSDVAVIATADIDPVVGSEDARAQAAADTEQALTGVTAADAGWSWDWGWPGGTPTLLDLVMIGGATLALLLFIAAMIMRRRSRRAAGSPAGSPAVGPAIQTRRSNRKR